MQSLMARKFTPLYTSIWQEADFTALDPTSQALYFTLISQPNINSVGLLPITQRRWRGCATWSPEAFAAALAALVAARFVMVDADTEELLIRTFVKWDGGANHPLRVKSIIKDAEAVQSSALREFIASELVGLGLMKATPQRPLSDHSAYTNGIDVPTVPVTLVGTHGNQEPGTSNREPAEGEPSPVPVDDPTSKFCPKHQPDGTDEPCGPCRGRRERAEARLTDRAKLAADRKAELAQARRDCRDCNEAGWIEDADHKPLRRCGHPKLVAQPESRTA